MQYIFYKWLASQCRGVAIPLRVVFLWFQPMILTNQIGLHESVTNTACADLERGGGVGIPYPLENSKLVNLI